jgi:hypothetical protein
MFNDLRGGEEHTVGQLIAEPDPRAAAAKNYILQTVTGLTLNQVAIKNNLYYLNRNIRQ